MTTASHGPTITENQKPFQKNRLLSNVLCVKCSLMKVEVAEGWQEGFLITVAKTCVVQIP